QDAAARRSACRGILPPQQCNRPNASALRASRCRCRRQKRPPPVMDLVTFYSQNLAVPSRRDLDRPDVLAGKKTFYEIGCIA
ncbi:thiol oxidoreductase, partial [Mesorhizobium sp. M7A.F.Ca.CA.004.09.1.2]